MLAREFDIKKLATVGMLLLALLELLRTAWISDDAAITLRCVLNFLHGFGPQFNLDERVQAFTHPLWFLLLSGVTLVTQNVFLATFLCSISCSLLAMWLLVARVAVYFWSGFVGVSILLLSKAYVDFSTSGLENPLAHVMLLCLVIVGLRGLNRAAQWRDWVCFFASVAGLYLTRPDLVLLGLPVAILIIYTQRQQSMPLVCAMALGLLPALAWTVFSLLYYGLFFSNTAYAKLATGIPRMQLMWQGVYYFLDSAYRDPLTLAGIVGGMVLSLSARAFERALALGILLYLIYIISIGGDFMSGRFFTTPLLMAVVIWVRTPLNFRAMCLASFVIAGCATESLRSTLLSDSSYYNRVISPHGIADERGFYYQDHGLLAAHKPSFTHPDWSSRPDKSVVLCGGLGFYGLMRGPGVHLIDNCALSDPLLARIPAAPNPNWRIGHFIRQLPTGYQASIDANNNEITDPDTRNYYAAIRTITRGPIWDLQRLKAILGFNLGLMDKPRIT